MCSKNHSHLLLSLRSFYLDDDYYNGGGGEIIYYINAFFDTREVGPPIYPDPSTPDEFGAGNVNLYSDAPLWDLFSIGASALIGLVQGTCTRTDPNDVDSLEYEGDGICSFTFEALSGSDVVASFTAEGTVKNAGDNYESSILVIKGGLGQFSGISGEVYLDTAYLDFDFSPPQAIYDDQIDFLASPDGYLMYGTIYSDTRIDVLEAGDDYYGDDRYVDTLDDVPIGDIDDAPISETSVPTETVPPTVVDDGSAVLGLKSVLCPTQPEEEFCDCSSDCVNFPDTRCGCREAKRCCTSSS